MSRTLPVCAQCHAPQTRIKILAEVRWDVLLQQWQVMDVVDGAECKDCGCLTQLVWIPAPAVTA